MMSTLFTAGCQRIFRGLGALGFTLALALIPWLVGGQPTRIEVRIQGSLAPRATLYRYAGDRPEPVDTALAAGLGQFHFALRPDHPQGLYRIAVGPDMAFDVVVAREPLIDIRTHAHAPTDSLRSHHSLENTLYWRYQRQMARHGRQAWHIESLKEFYPQESKFRELLALERYRQRQLLHRWALDLAVAYPHTLAAQLILLDQSPPWAPASAPPHPDSVSAAAWWSGVDLHDPRLASAPALGRRLWDYVGQLFHNDLCKEEQDGALARGIERLLALPMHPEIRAQMGHTLVRGIWETDYRDVAQLVKATAGLGPLALPADTVGRTDGHAPRVRVGQVAFDFPVTTPEGKRVKLSGLDAPYKLVVFWSVWCSHCLEAMPKLMDIYHRYKHVGLEVVAVAVDQEEGMWQSQVRGLGLTPWIHIREPVLGDSPMLRAYQVEQTPKMFLLDRHLTIISRPVNHWQLEARLRRL